jgi:ADP-heptose:LPS heptosyltransferase
MSPKTRPQGGRQRSRQRRRSAQLRIPSCKHFTGYKPCFPGSRCFEKCEDFDPIGKKILIVNLDAMGNVLVTTSVLPALKRKYPKSHISWITLKNTAPLLMNNPYLDRVYVWEPESWLILQRIRFDLVLNVDKSQRSGAFTDGLRAKEKRGFGLNDNGVIVPLNKEARESYLLGLDDNAKFRLNQKSVPQLQCEQFKLRYARDRYVLRLTPDEETFCRSYAKEVGIAGGDLVVGFNTGCSDLYPNKKMTIEQHARLIEMLHGTPAVKLVLVGGPEDTLRNAEIARRVGNKVISTPTTEGVRRGVCYENICDLMITGDSFGMHVAIGLGKFVIVWFGVSCWTEIDLFDNGVKLIPEGLACSPCWKRACPFNLECIDRIDLDRIVAAVKGFRKERHA